MKRILLIAALLAITFPVGAFAVQVLTTPLYEEHDNDGEMLSGGKIYTYECGTLTDKATYKTEALMTPNTNPIILDSAGRASNQIFFSGCIKISVSDADDTTLYTEDNIYGSGEGGVTVAFRMLSSFSGTIQTGTNTTADATGVTMTDSTASFNVNAYTGQAIYNTTDGSSCTVTGNTATAVSCSGGLTGGADDEWSLGDAYSISDSGKLTEAVASIGDTPTTLFIDVNDTVAANLSVPTNIALVGLNGALLTVSSSVELAILGSFSAGDYQAFDGDGTVTINQYEGLNALWFGMVADGSDCKEEMEFLLRSAASNESTSIISFPPGDYVITNWDEQYRMPGTLVMRGEGIGTTVLTFEGTATAPVINGGSVYVSGLTVTGLANRFISYDLDDSFTSISITVDNCMFDTVGLPAASTSTEPDGVIYSYTQSDTTAVSVNVSNCLFYECYGSVMIIEDEVTSALITNNTVQNGYNSAFGVETSPASVSTEIKNVIITGNTIDGLESYPAGHTVFGIGTHGSAAIISGNIIRNIEDGGTLSYAIKCGSTLATISDNSAIDCHSAPATIYVGDGSRGEELAPEGYGSIVTGNHITHSSTDYTGENGILIKAGEATVSNNKISGYVSNAAILVTGNLNLGQIIIAGNQLYGIEGEAGISIEYGFSTNMMVTNNIINAIESSLGSTVAYGIYVDSEITSPVPTGIIINNNMINDVDGGGAGESNGIMIAPTATVYNVTINGNTISNVDDFGIKVSTEYPDRLQVKNNMIMTTGDDAISIDDDVSGYTEVFGNVGATMDPTTLEDCSSAPSVKRNINGLYIINNTDECTITDFSDGLVGQRIHVVHIDENTTDLKFTGTTQLQGESGSDFQLAQGDFFDCVLNSQDYWDCRASHVSP